jgi:hypothetical protein
MIAGMKVPPFPRFFSFLQNFRTIGRGTKLNFREFFLFERQLLPPSDQPVREEHYVAASVDAILRKRIFWIA